jgi:hypothetical protein
MRIVRFRIALATALAMDATGALAPTGIGLRVNVLFAVLLPRRDEGETGGR